MKHTDLEYKDRYYNLLHEVESMMDIINGDYGTREAMCVYCKSKEHNGRVGIVHTKDCAIQQVRDLLNKR